MARVLTIAVLVSGTGTTLDGLAERIAQSRLSARIALVLADRWGTAAIERARQRDLQTIVVVRRGVDGAEWSRAVAAALEARGVELIVLAGFLAILPSQFVAHFAGRIVNLHPALLPRYGGRGMYGNRVHSAVLQAGDPESGATVHLVTDAVDAGPILLQERVPVLPGDTPETLRARLHPAEVEVLARVIARFADGSWPLPYSGRAPG